MPFKEKAHLSGGPIPNFVLADNSDTAESLAARQARSAFASLACAR